MKTKEITVSCGATISLGNFNSFRAEYSETVIIDDVVVEGRLHQDRWEKVRRIRAGCSVNRQ